MSTSKSPPPKAAAPSDAPSASSETPSTPPSWITESEGTVQTSAAVEPEVPERNYDRDPRLLQWIPPAGPVPPNRTLQTFFRLLANILFWGGGATALVALFYKVRSARGDGPDGLQRVVLPRLAVLDQRLASLHTQHLSLFDRLALNLRTLVTDNESLYGRSAALLAAREKLPEDEQTAQDAGVIAAPVPAQAAEHSALAPEEPRMFEPILSSLQSLRTELNTFSPVPVPAPTRPDLVRPSPALVEAGLPSSATRGLLTSLEDLSTYISTTQFYLSQSFISAQSSRTVGAAAGTSVSVGGATQPDTAMQCRSEIRALKGLLLNRRSFAFAPSAASS